MTESSEDRLFARDDRRRGGSVLIVGVGSVGSYLAEELAYLGVRFLSLVDKETVEPENFLRHVLKKPYEGWPKATSLAKKIHEDFPPCHTEGLDEDFLKLDEQGRLGLINQVDLVVGATDDDDCQRLINELCVRVGKPAIYPAFWSGNNILDAEAGHVLRVLPGEIGPCYACAESWLPQGVEVGAVGGNGAEIRLVSNLAAKIIIGILHPEDVYESLIEEGRTAVLVHALFPPSDSIAYLFAEGNTRPVRVSLPPLRCQVCGAQATPLPQLARAITLTDSVTIRPVPPPQPVPRQSGYVWVSVAFVVLILIVGIFVLSHNGSPSQASSSDQQASSAPAVLASAQPTASSTPSPTMTWSSGQQVDSSNSFTAISCPTTSFCMLVDSVGTVYTYSTGTQPHGPEPDTSGNGLTAVSCANANFCAAITSGATAYVYNDGNWSSSSLENGAANLTAISCPADGYCVATGDETIYTYSNGAWGPGDEIQDQNDFTGISCPTTSFCMAVDSNEDFYTYTNGSWSPGTEINNNQDFGFTAISCPSTTFCAAITREGTAYIDSNGSWTSSTLVAADGGGANLGAVSCASASFCVATGLIDVYLYTGNSWAQGQAIQTDGFTAISCPTTSFCMAVDGDGNVFTYAAG